MKHNFEKLFNLSSRVAIVIRAASAICNEITKFLIDVGAIKTLFRYAIDMYIWGTGSNLVVEGGGLA